MAVLLYTGLRASELLNLKVSDISFQSGKILVEEGKGGKDRVIPVYRKLERILRRYMDARARLDKTSMYLFTGVRSEKRLNYKNLQIICKRISQEIKIQFTPHQLRHTFASVCVEKEMPLPQLQQVMGHSDIKTTMIYVSVTQKATMDAFSKIDLF